MCDSTEDFRKFGFILAYVDPPMRSRGWFGHNFIIHNPPILQMLQTKIDDDIKNVILFTTTDEDQLQ